MSNTFNPYHEWLGLAPDAQSPDYYQLLGVDRFEKGPDTLRAAADRALAKVRGFRPGSEAAAWARVLDELAAAKNCLCDPARKQAYDRTLSDPDRADRNQKSSAASEPEIAPVNLSPDLYPPGMARPSSDTRESARSTGTAQPKPAEPARTSQTPPAPTPRSESKIAASATKNALPPTTAPESVSSPPSAVVPVTPQPDAARLKPRTPVRPGSHPTTANREPLVLADDPVLSGPLNAHVAPPRQEPKSPLPIVLAIAAVLILATLAIMFLAMRDTSGKSSSATTAAPGTTPPATALAAPSPRQQTVPLSNRPQGRSPAKPAESREDKIDPTPSLVPTQPPASKKTAKSAVPPAEKLEDTLPRESEAPKTELKHDTSKSKPSSKITPSPAPATSKPAVMTAANLRALGQALTSARAALGRHEFEIVTRELDKAAEIAVLAEHQMLVGRLRLLGERAQQFWQIVGQAVEGLQAAQELKIGSGDEVVIVVDTGPDWITIHRSGRNTRYSFAHMPPGLALAIAKQTLDTRDADHLILLGACLATVEDPKKAHLDEARRYWNQAQMNGADVGDLLKSLSDSYALER